MPCQLLRTRCSPKSSATTVRAQPSLSRPLLRPPKPSTCSLQHSGHVSSATAPEQPRPDEAQRCRLICASIRTAGLIPACFAVMPISRNPTNTTPRLNLTLQTYPTLLATFAGYNLTTPNTTLLGISSVTFLPWNNRQAGYTPANTAQPRAASTCRLHALHGDPYGHVASAQG